MNIADIRGITSELQNNGFDWTHAFYIGTISLSLLGDVLIPILFFRFERRENAVRQMHADNKAEREEETKSFHKRMDHLDECIDAVKDKVAASAATKADLLDMRTALLTEFAELAKRVYRLEDNSFRRKWF